MNYGERT
jgi:hypothetical protein